MNIRKVWYIALTMFLLLMISLPVMAKVIVERISYHGWIDSYRLTSGATSLVVVPEIGGRIMEFSSDGQNVIWENPDEYGRTYPMAKENYNFGGYKMWVAPEGLLGWPPDPMLNYGKANIEVFQNPKGLPVLRVTGAPSIDNSLVFIREITLDDSGEAVIKQIIRNIGPKPISYSIWDITQVQTPCFVAFPVKATSRFDGGISYIVSESKNSRQFNVKDGLCVTSYLGEFGKIGADSDGPWMVWFKDDLAYVKFFQPMVKGSEYPDGGCSAEIYTNDSKQPYLEMEILGPLTNLKSGEQTELVERWKLFKLTQPVKDENWVYKAVKGMKGKGWIP